jgi:hypothetical protein
LRRRPAAYFESVVLIGTGDGAAAGFLPPSDGLLQPASEPSSTAANKTHAALDIHFIIILSYHVPTT